MSTVKSPGSKRFDEKMSMHTPTHNADVSLAHESPKNLYHELYKHGIMDDGITKISFK